MVWYIFEKCTKPGNQTISAPCSAIFPAGALGVDFGRKTARGSPIFAQAYEAAIPAFPALDATAVF